MKHIEARIMGQSYTLGCPEGGETLLQNAVDRVDAAMCKILDAGKVKARDRIAVLAALNLAFDLCQLEAARSPTPSATDPTPPPVRDESIPTADPRIAQLIERLDQALASDDHLL